MSDPNDDINEDTAPLPLPQPSGLAPVMLQIEPTSSVPGGQSSNTSVPSLQTLGSSPLIAQAPIPLPITSTTAVKSLSGFPSLQDVTKPKRSDSSPETGDLPHAALTTSDSFFFNDTGGETRYVDSYTYIDDPDSDDEPDEIEDKEVTDASLLLSSISPFKARDDLSSAGLLGIALAGGKFPFVMRSCGFFEANSRLRKSLIKIFISPKFERYIWFLLLVNTLIAGYHLEPSSHNLTNTRQLVLEYLQIAILVIFTLEALFKMIAFGIYQHKFAYFKSVWDRIDFYIVVISWLAWALGGSIYLGYTTIFRCLRIIKPQEPPRDSKEVSLQENNTDRKSVSRALIKSLVLLAQFAVVLIIFYFLFGILGVQLYRGTLRNRCYKGGTMVNPDRPCSTDPDTVGAWFCEKGEICKEGPTNPGRGWASFDNIFLSMLTIFQVSSQVGWTDVMYLVQDANGFDNWIFFVLIILVFTFFLLNLTAAVLIEGFDSSLPDEDDIQLKKQVRDQEIATQGRIHQAAVFADKRKQYQLQMLQKRINPASTAARDLAESVFGEIPILGGGTESLKFVNSDSLFSPSVEPPKQPKFSGPITIAVDPESSPSTAGGDPPASSDSESLNPTSEDVTPSLNLDDIPEDSEGDTDSSTPRVPFLTRVSEKWDKFTTTIRNWAIKVYMKDSFEYGADIIVASNLCVASAAYYHPDNLMTENYWWSIYGIYLFTVIFLELPEVIIKMIGYTDSILTNDSTFRKFLMALNPSTYSPLIYDSRFEIYPEKVKIARFGIQFDTIVISISIVEAILYLSGVWPFPTMFCVFRSFRFAIMILRHMYKNDDISDNIDMFIGSSFAIFRLFIFLAAFIFIFAIVGMGLFGKTDIHPGMVLPDGEPPRANYNSFWNALVSTFQLVSTENLFLILWDAMVLSPLWGATYVVFVVSFSNYILLNLFVGIIVSVFSTRSRTLRAREAVQHVREWESMQQRMQSRVFILELAILSKKIGNEMDSSDSPTSPTPDNSASQSTQPLAPISSTGLSDDTQLNDTPDDDETKEDNPNFFQRCSKSISNSLNSYHPERSYFIFSESNIFRTFASYYTDTIFLQVLIIVATLVTFFIVAGDFTQGIGSSSSLNPASDYSYYIAVAYTAFYGLEIFLRGVSKHLIRGKSAYLATLENRLDFLIFCCILINVASSRVLVIFFLLPFRLFSRSTPGVIVIVSSLIKASKDLIHLFFLGVVVYWIFAVNGTALFGGRFQRCECHLSTGDIVIQDKWDMDKCLASSTEAVPCLWKPFFFYFDNIFHSITALFVASNLAGVMDLLWAGVDAVAIGAAPIRDYHPIASLYFIAFIITSAFIIINLFVGVVVDTFTTIYEELAGVAYLTGRQREWIEAKRWISLEKPIALPPAPAQGRFLRWRHFCHYIVTFPYHDFHQQVLSGRMPHMQSRFSLTRYIESWVNGNYGKDAYTTVNMSDVRTYFDSVIFVLIIMNTGLAAVEHHDQEPWITELLFWGNLAFLALFIGEAVFRVSALGWKNYWANPWNKFDFIIIIVSIFSLSLLYLDISTKRVVSPQILRVGRLIRILRLLKTKKIRRVLTTLYSAIPNTVDIILVLVLLLFGFSLGAVAMFGNIPQDGWINPRANFETFGMSMLTLVRIMTVDSWSYIMYDCMFRPEAPGYISFPFYVFYVVLMSYVILSLFIAILLDKFSLTSALETGTVNSENVARFRTVWLAYDPYATGHVPSYALRSMLTQIPRPLGLEGTTRPGIDLLNLAKKLRIRCTNGRVEFRSLLLSLASIALGQPRVEAELSGVFGSSAVFRIKDKYGLLDARRWKFLPRWVLRRLPKGNTDSSQHNVATSASIASTTDEHIPHQETQETVADDTTSVELQPTTLSETDTTSATPSTEPQLPDERSNLQKLIEKIKEQELTRKYILSHFDLGIEPPPHSNELIFAGSFYTKTESVIFSQPTLHKEIAASIIQANYRGYLARKKLHSEMTETYHQVLLSPISLLKKLSLAILKSDQIVRNQAVVEQHESHANRSVSSGVTPEVLTPPTEPESNDDIQLTTLD